MIKAYYYFLFRIYRYYKDKEKETEFQSLFGVVAVSSTLLAFNVMSVYFFLEYFNFIPPILFKSVGFDIIFMILLSLLNYLFIIRKKTFLSFGFSKDKKGGWLSIIYMILSFALIITIGSFNHQKRFSNMPPSDSNQPKQESLEGKVRDWIKNL